MKRRDLLKGLAGLPVLGIYGSFLYSDIKKNVVVESEFSKFIRSKLPLVSGNTTQAKASGVRLRIGIVGIGKRGTSLLKALGFVHPSAIDKMTDDARKFFLAQPDLNIEITAVCDLYAPRLDTASVAAANIDRCGQAAFTRKPVKKYAHFQDLISDNEVDAVVIATSDQWHAPIAIAAAKQGKHVYCEKALTHNLEDAFNAKKEITASGVVFQLGHQNRQAENYITAQQIVKSGMLGPINLVETTTNRNSPDGAWLYDIPEDAGLQNVDWKSFLRDQDIPFNKERFFRWRLFWDYSTGLAGDLLTHEYDCINQILEIGIPERVTASGGIYHWKDNREVPDVFQVLMEYPQRQLSVVYSASLASNRSRPRLLMGNDASLEIGGSLSLTIDKNSVMYEKYLKNQDVEAGKAIDITKPDQVQIDAISSATEKYFSSRGLLFTSRNGQLMDTTHLHMDEWINAIRSNGKTSCNIDRAFEEAVTAQMATMAYRQNRVVRWNGEQVV